MSEKQTYEVIYTVEHNGALYKKGSEISLSTEEAVGLIACDAIREYPKPAAKQEAEPASATAGKVLVGVAQKQVKNSSNAVSEEAPAPASAQISALIPIPTTTPAQPYLIYELGPSHQALGTAIADAEALINAALQQHYTLPLQNPPRLLQRIALDLVHECLHEGVLPEEVKRRGDHARTDSFMRRKNGAGLGCQRERSRRPTRKC